MSGFAEERELPKETEGELTSEPVVSEVVEESSEPVTPSTPAVPEEPTQPVIIKEVAKSEPAPVVQPTTSAKKEEPVPASPAVVEEEVEEILPEDYPQPLQIIKIGDDSSGDCFQLQEDNLTKILSKIPPDMKVSVIAVVGAFRSGKSFLLNFFLRYLRSGQADDLSQAWMFSEGEELVEGNCNEGDWSIVDPVESKRNSSFAWRGGVERQTTGIWLWSEPFFRATTASNGEKFAILLMDTQGMFDNETTMTLTAQIFGLSTLVSSFQIYNVEKKIQEDNLQHLALFSEYGRMALAPQAEQEAKKEELLAKTTPVTALPSPEEVLEKQKAREAFQEEAEARPALRRAASLLEKNVKKPFQRVQFLIRDWQNFDKDYEEEEDSVEWFQTFLDGMNKYITEVLRDRDYSDLQSTREQILRCFEKLDCFMLPHPGNAVTKKTYDGTIRKIDASFRGLVNRYVRLIFDEDLEPKEINHRQITAQELKTYFEVYSRMFQSGEKTFPKAMTMLDATAEANNRNAYDLALQHYKVHMELLVGANKAFVKEVEVLEKHQQYQTRAEAIFDEIATMGSPSMIEKARNELMQDIENERNRYVTTNALRNPFRDMEYYILPATIAFGAWFLAVVTDKTCSTDFCENIEDTFVNIYLFVFFAFVVVFWRQISGALKYFKEYAPAMLDQVSKK